MLEIGPTRSEIQGLDSGWSNHHMQTGRSPHKGLSPCPDSPGFGPLQQQSEHTSESTGLPLIHFDTVFTNKQKQSVYMTVNPSHNVVLPTNMWEGSWRFRSSGRADVLPDKCLLMLWGHTHPRTQHLLPADQVLYNNHVYIGDRLLKPYYLSREDHNWKIRTSKQRRDVGKYSFINRTIKSWTNYLQAYWRLSPVN